MAGPLTMPNVEAGLNASQERPETLLRSALEKIIYFEARAEQLAADLLAARQEAERLREDLSAAGQREMAFRRELSELQLQTGRAQRERDEQLRMNEALRAERAGLIGRLIEASRIHGNDDADGELPFDLAAFISELRSEALRSRPEALVPSRFGSGSARSGEARGKPRDAALSEGAPAGREAQGSAQRAIQGDLLGDAGGARASERTAESAALTEPPPPSHASEGQSGDLAGADPDGWGMPPKAPVPLTEGQVSPNERIAAHARRFRGEGRLDVSVEDLLALSTEPEQVRTDGPLGAALRELSSLDARTRRRAAERLAAFGESAAGPALASALHVETVVENQVALLDAFAKVAGDEGAQIVSNLSNDPAPEVRIAALRALLKLAPSDAAPHLSTAMRDADPTVRRRASLMALSLEGSAALELGEQALRDDSAAVRRVGALALGASGGERARTRLLEVLADADSEVRHAAAQALSRILGVDVTTSATLTGPNLRREVRRLRTLPARPLRWSSASLSSQGARNGGGCSSPSASSEAERERGLHPRSGSLAERGDAGASLRPSRSLAGALRGEASAPSAPPHASASPRAARASSTGAAAASTGVSPAPSSGIAADSALCEAVLLEVRTSIRGCLPQALSSAADAPPDAVEQAIERLVAEGRLTRRGRKLFFAA